MWLSKKLEDAEDPAAKTQDLRFLASSAMQEYRQGISKKDGHHYFSMIWASFTPKGNIYRYNGLTIERLKNNENLWRQLLELSERHRAMLGGEAASEEERCIKLLDALGKTTVKGMPGMEVEEACTGFKPLEEYLHGKVVRVGPILCPADSDARSQWARHRFVAFLIMMLQVLGPYLVFWNRWHWHTNQLQHPNTLFERLTWREAFCLGPGPQEQATTILGVVLLYIIIFIVRCYVYEQVSNADKTGRLPTDSIWYFMGVCVKAWCCVFTVLDIPLLFWSEETPTNIVLDSMTLLFVKGIDDLGDILCSYVGLTDEDFQRVAGWNCAMLSQCPLILADLTNPAAKSVQELWCIRYNEAGQLLAADGKQCETRLLHLPAGEDRPLAAGRSDPEQQPLLYRRSASHSVELPSTLAKGLGLLWQTVSVFLLMMQILLPPLYFIVNKPCHSVK
eukprot:gnl/TRDRNA2_/TRDRNA2_83185_c1_seq1.p1 gnl/TRDRNA2_/TRDRNA2_83185_c1~~gnl/TRDRNA2_/TRDRNA2_83185_c1_seq1.p1  ORF type:complete len:449 (-),score=83.28 gnl/TRDRNA2_/TRDRNA2_83185_c1_seq1:63-1409(-)